MMVVVPTLRWISMLAFADASERERYLAGTALRKLTPFTVCTRSGLEARFRDVRKLGYSLLVSEFVDGLAGLSVPVRDHEGRVVAAIGISMVLGSMNEERLLALCLEPLRTAVEKVERLLRSMHSRS